MKRLHDHDEMIYLIPMIEDALALRRMPFLSFLPRSLSSAVQYMYG